MRPLLIARRAACVIAASRLRRGGDQRRHGRPRGRVRGLAQCDEAVGKVIYTPVLDAKGGFLSDLTGPGAATGRPGTVR